jgi:hypothetical protein
MSEPLAAFSRYLAGRHQVLLAIADEIVGHLDAATRSRASDLMWLWTLGAYEVVRTMCQARDCFAPEFYRGLADLKLELERVRVASTKMERINYDRRARAVPIGSDRAPDEWDAAALDLLVGDPAHPASARRLLAAYRRVLGSLTAADVRMRHEDAF